MPRYIDADKLKTRIAPESLFRDTLVEWIDLQETEDVAPVVHGSWIKDDNEQCYCSACMDDHHRPMFFTPHSQWRYCPWCGAKMDEEVEL